MQVCFLHTLFLEYATETRGNKCKAVFYRYKRIGMRSLELFWPFSILAKNLGDVLAHSLSNDNEGSNVSIFRQTEDSLELLNIVFENTPFADHLGEKDIHFREV